MEGFIHRYFTLRTLWLLTVLILKVTWIIGIAVLSIAVKAFLGLFLIVGGMFMNTPTVMDPDRH